MYFTQLQGFKLGFCKKKVIFNISFSTYNILVNIFSRSRIATPLSIDLYPAIPFTTRLSPSIANRYEESDLGSKLK